MNFVVGHLLHGKKLLVVPLVLIGLLNWVWVGPRGFGDKVLGTGLDNKTSVTLDALPRYPKF